MSTSSKSETHPGPGAPRDPVGAGGTGVRRARRSRRLRAPELNVETFLGVLRVSELQEMWEFWQNGTRAPDRRQDLLDALRKSLQDEAVVGARMKVLSDRPREVLVRIVRCDGYRATLPDLVAAGEGSGLEPYEVEAAARALARRGFLRVEHANGGDAAPGRGHREVYAMPRDLGDAIAALLLEERRGPRDVFTVAGFLGSVAPSALGDLLERLGAESGAEAADAAAAVLAAIGGDPLATVEEAGLREALRRAALEHGGVLPRAAFDALSPGAPAAAGKRLRSWLEGRALGTVTSLRLDEYGIDLGGETVVLFAEVTERILAGATPADPASLDRVEGARVDLLTDLQSFLDLVEESPLRVTQGRSIYRAAQHRILETFVSAREGLLDRERIFGLVYDLAFGLELVEVSDESRLRLTRKGEHWHETDLADKVRAVYGRFLEERLLDGRDFHVRRLRRAVAAALAAAPEGAWLPLDHVPFVIRNGYLGALDEQGVREQYRNRFQYVYTPPRETPAALHEGLRDYVLTRLYALGLADVGISHGVPAAVRMTELGRRLVGGVALGPAPEERSGRERGRVAETARPLVVNPDFEVILFPEGDVNEVAHRLDRFATRTKSDEVAHYRISRDGVERAVVKGMASEEILEFLEMRARVPVPQNVAYSIREWASRVALLRQREVVLLSASTAEALDRALAIEDVQRLLVERLSPTSAALRSRIAEWETLEALRACGVYFRD